MSDDEDLEEIRRMRAGKAPALDGPLGDKLAELRRRQAAASRDQSIFADAPGPSRPPGPSPQRLRESSSLADDGDDDESMPSVVIPSEEVDMDPSLRVQLPLQFGATEKKPQVELKKVLEQTRRTDDAEIGPPRPPPGRAKGDDDDDDEEADEDGDDDDQDEGGRGGVQYEDPYHLPVTHEVVLKGHSRLVSCLDVEHSGSRLVSGGFDYNVRLYDFNGMKRDLRPFRELEQPCGSHQIRAVSWSPSGDQFIVISGSSQPKLFDRDGRTLGEFGKGDMYIRDLKHTKGHIMGCTSGQWSPVDKQTCLTASEDGSLRLWDVSYASKEDMQALKTQAQVAVIKPQQLKPGRQSVTACCFSPDGKTIAGAVSDGSIQFWSATSNFSSAAVGQVLPPRQQLHQQNHWSYSNKTVAVFKGAHPMGEDVTSLRFNREGTLLLTRCMDGSMKLWDVRNTKAPLREVGGLETGNAHTQAVFSPDEGLVVTAVNASREGASGALAFFETSSFKLVRRLGVPGGSAVALQWHAKLNQIFVGAGGAKEGAPRILYDPDFSNRGALLAVARAPRLKDPADLMINPVPVEFVPRKAGGTRKRLRDAKEEKQRKLRIPQPPQGQYGAGGALGQGTGGTLLTQHLLKEKGALRPRSQEMDPREAILRHAEAAAKDPKFVETAYLETQPKRIFAEVEEEEEPEEYGKD